MENELLWETPHEKQLKIAESVRQIRKANKISQERLSILSGVSFGTIRRFEKEGEISLASFVKILFALGLNDRLDLLFEGKTYKSIEDVLNDR